MRMRLLGTALAVSACRQDGGLAPEAEARPVPRAEAQCLAPLPGDADSGSAVIETRIASALGRGAAVDVVCLSLEGGRWRLRSSR